MHKVSLKDVGLMLLFFAIGYGWIMIDQIFLPQSWQRMIALIIVAFILMLIYYWIIKPASPLKLANTLAVTFMPLAISASLVSHVIVRHDFMLYLNKILLIWFVILGCIYAAAGVYRIARKIL